MREWFVKDILAQSYKVSGGTTEVETVLNPGTSFDGIHIELASAKNNTAGNSIDVEFGFVLGGVRHSLFQVRSVATGAMGTSGRAAWLPKESKFYVKVTSDVGAVDVDIHWNGHFLERVKH